MESRRRTVMKALSWRLVAVIVTATVVWVITGRPELAASVGVADSLIKLVAYYLHERAWNRVRLGKRAVSDHEADV